MATKTSSSNKHDSTCIVKFDGETSVTGDDGEKYELKDGYSIRRVEVDQRQDAPTFFSVELSFLKQADFAMLDCFKPGMEVSITLGGAEEGVVCNGEVSYVEPRFMSGKRTVVVSGYDKSHRLTRGTESRAWASSDGWAQDQEFKTFIEDAIKKSQGREGEVSDSLSADVDSLTAKVEWFGQYECNNFQFLQSLGLATGLSGAAKDAETAGKVAVKKGDLTASAVVKIRSERGAEEDATVEDAKFRLSVVRQVKKVEVRGWDYKKKEAIKGEAKDLSTAFDGDAGPALAGESLYGGTSSGSVLTVTDCPVSSKDEADQIAQAILDKLGMELMTGEITMQGDARLTPGDIVELEAFGARYSGKWLVTGATHELNMGRYRTFLTIGRNASPKP